MPKNTGAAISPGQTNTPERGRLERVTVNLTAKSSLAMNQAVRITGDSKTDTINRALQLYAYLEQVVHDGGEVHIRESGASETERIKFL